MLFTQNLDKKKGGESMFFAQVDEEGRIICVTEAPINPDRSVWNDVLQEQIPDDFSDYKLVDGKLVYESRDLPPIPFTTDQVLSMLLQETDVFPDSVLEHMAPYMHEWSVGTDYSVGDKVQYLERPYRCLRAHKSENEQTPAKASLLWTRIIAEKFHEV